MNKTDSSNKHSFSELPPDLLNRFREIERDFLQTLRSDPNLGFLRWKELFEETIRRQPILGRFHKGGIVHNMGISKVLLISPLEAAEYFLMGFIEDIISTHSESGASPETAPAALNLKNIFHFTDEDLKFIREEVENEKDREILGRPDLLIKNLKKLVKYQDLERKAAKFSPHLKPRKNSISRIPGEWEKRVFVGGDYYENLYVLNWVKIIVEKCGFTPILAIEFSTPIEIIHDFSLLLLHSCKHSIFDISTRGGHLMEIERTIDYKTNTLFVCKKGRTSTITAMLTSLGKTPKEFDNIDDLQKNIMEFLS